MLITELFDSSQTLTWEPDGMGGMEAEFQIKLKNHPNQHLLYSLQVTTADAGAPPDFYVYVDKIYGQTAKSESYYGFIDKHLKCIEFGEKDAYGTMQFGLTNSGQAAEIFGIVINGLKDLFRQRGEPGMLFFSGKEPSRIKFYNRLISTLGRKYGYVRIGTERSDYFLLMKPMIDDYIRKM